MEETDEPRPRRRAIWIVAMLAVVFVLYPLSIGPAYVLLVRKPAPATAFKIIYWPLIQICKTGGFDESLNAYIVWWLRVTGNR